MAKHQTNIYYTVQPTEEGELIKQATTLKDLVTTECHSPNKKDSSRSPQKGTTVSMRNRTSKATNFITSSNSQIRRTHPWARDNRSGNDAITLKKAIIEWKLHVV